MNAALGGIHEHLPEVAIWAKYADWRVMRLVALVSITNHAVSMSSQPDMADPRTTRTTWSPAGGSRGYSSPGSSGDPAVSA